MLGRRWLREHGVSPDAASLIAGAGDSMAPTILDGDAVLVDTSDRTVREAIFVFRRGEGVAIKRVRRRPDGSFVLASDNAAYGEEPLPPEESDATAIRGRVAYVFKQV